MFKMIALLKRKSGMSFEAFRTYYEDRHVPLVKSIMQDRLLTYVRNYVDTTISFPVGRTVDFDCISEFHYRDRAAFVAAMQAIQHPDNVDRVRADERNFLDTDAACMFRVDPAGPGDAALEAAPIADESRLT